LRFRPLDRCMSIFKHTSAYVAYFSIRQHTNMPTLFPDRQLRFRPLDSCMSICSVRQHT
jgi:hypothetical protein